MAVLLIGSTGNGKSTLGNYLLHPDEPGNDEEFKMGTDNKPQTQYVKTVSKELTTKVGQRKKVTLIDTPGLNECAAKDLKHMIEVIKELRKVREVQACFLVVKFNSKIDAQYRATVQYYSKLLHHLFERNVFIIMTHFANDDHALRLRELQKIDVKKVKDNTVRAIVECANLDYDPILFTIDCLPMDEEEKRVNWNVRDAIIEHIFTTEPIKVANLNVAKTAEIKIRDNEKAEKYIGQIDGYKERLQEADKSAKEALEKFREKDKELTNVCEIRTRTRSEVEDKDTTERVVIKTWSVSEEWRVFRALKEKFDLQTQWKILDVQKNNNGYAEWREFKKDDHRVSGKVVGNFMRGLYATLTIETSSHIRYAREIRRLRSSIEKQTEEMKRIRSERDNIRTTYKEHQEKLELMQTYIDRNTFDITYLSRDYMTIEKAEETLMAMTI